MPPDPQTARLLDALAGLDLASADGRAGLGVVLAEIERAAPDAILRHAASIELRRVGFPLPPPRGEGGCRAATDGWGPPRQTSQPTSAPDPHGPA